MQQRNGKYIQNKWRDNFNRQNNIGKMKKKKKKPKKKKNLLMFLLVFSEQVKKVIITGLKYRKRDLILILYHHNNCTTIIHMRVDLSVWSPLSCEGLLCSCCIDIINLTFFIGKRLISRTTTINQVEVRRHSLGSRFQVTDKK